ncbi:MAG: LysM peptidoglycan-binding domain-containing protein [Anaerolineales bacterium]|nr:LysM peptidoglycan-binding domain-containing protein [Anaerolineales bacterium]
MRKTIRGLMLFMLFLLAFSLPTAKEVSADPQIQITAAGQLIDAVNSLRLSYGLPALTSHPILMQSAQSQADYMAATGQVTHSRPGGTTYTQQLLTLGFPLAGDLSLGGFRAENILSSGSPLVWNGVPPAWQDADHMNTMLSQNFTHIGAGVSQGAGGFFYAVDTAAATGSGQMQESASSILGNSSNGSNEAAGVSQYMVPVVKATARPDGDVIHSVQYGQTLWSIAIEYGTTIKNIQALNNLGEDLVVYQGQALLIQKAATQPAPVATIMTIQPPATQPVLPATPTQTTVPPTVLAATPTIEIQAAETRSSSPSSSQFLVAVLIIAAVVGAGVAVWLIRDPN